MHLKSAIIDGFKSYGKRTEINGFDPEFNAITGLNGSGKSNILDSICFVLGISNLVQVRAKSLQELIFKNGQAGVTRASVTLIFDNRDSSQSPIGYERNNEITVTRQIAVGGKNKYIINGRVVTNKKVQDLFCSVQMNVNNPNFLIMQGRITKVLNMKPIEILAMIEEAAGTSLYKAKSERTMKTLSKKDSQLLETNKILEEELEPKLAKLREQKNEFIEYQKICRDIEYLTRIHIAFQYTQLTKVLNNCNSSITEVSNTIEKNRKQIESNIKESEELEEQAKVLQSKIDEESGGTLNEMETELAKHSKSLSTINGEKKGLHSAIEGNKRELRDLKKTIADEENMLARKEGSVSSAASNFEKLKHEKENDLKALAECQKKMEAVSMGLESDEDKSVQDKLTQVDIEISEANTTIKKSELELKQTEASLKTLLKNEMKYGDEAFTQDKRKQEKLQSEVHNLEVQMNNLDFSEESHQKLFNQKQKLEEEIRQLKISLDRKRAYRYDLQYTDPENGFDRRRVRGRVCKLFDVKNSKFNMALSQCAGGSLYNVVTDTDDTSKKLLQRGQLQQRTTFMPMNKINGSAIDNSVLRVAESLVGKENVSLALNVISYDREYDTVMKHIFGRTLICKDFNVAKQVTYHRQIMARSVTLDGDIVDPSGALSGGAAPTGNCILTEIGDIKNLEKELKDKENNLKMLMKEIAGVEELARRYTGLKEQFDRKKLELSGIAQKLANNTFEQQKNEIDNLKKRIEELQEIIKEAKEKQRTGKEKAKELKEILTDIKGYKEREIKIAKSSLESLKKKSIESTKNWEKLELTYEQHKIEIDNIKKSIESSKAQLQQCEESLNERNEKFNDLNRRAEEIGQIIKEFDTNIKKYKADLNQKHKELAQKLNKKNKLLKSNSELTAEIKNKEDEINKMKSENKDASNRITTLENKYPWIEEDRQAFGVKNTRYDFTKRDPKEAAKELQNLNGKKEQMSRHINERAMLLLEQEEKQMEKVIERRDQIIKDKKAIQKFISKFDEERKKKIVESWKIVDSNFSSIFSTLLPGAQAKLYPPDKQNCFLGLGIKVGFNGMWKESLAELSGGQRSLIALSLVLAMLKFNPAPLYILDEVDAALDISHTQNIGAMLKAHFKNSQFIIVSLKDGMFNNANVLFRTKFEDGLSCVTRTTNKQ